MATIPKNLIAVKQLRTDQLSGFVETVASGYIGPLFDALSGSLQDQIDGIEIGGSGGSVVSSSRAFSFAISSGADQIVCSYGETFGFTPKVVATVGGNSADPLILANIRSKTASSCTIDLSDFTRSPNYYLDLLISV